MIQSDEKDREDDVINGILMKMIRSVINGDVASGIDEDDKSYHSSADDSSSNYINVHGIMKR
jgi:malate synthase